jgi:cob(I)alamin adenosyltransferase
VERQMVDFEEQHPGEVPVSALVLMNRLSDYFFIISRFINHTNKVSEIEWIASKN